jgi:hypothetical protein
MQNSAISELADLAASLAPVHAALLERARALGTAFGIEVLDLRPGADGVWDVRVRLHGRAPEAAMRPGPTSTIPERATERAAVEHRPTPFTSPVIGSVPFDGDGTDDLLRFVAEADASVRVPARGRAGAPPPRLGSEERLRMLAEVIAGDALLSLVHQGLHADVAAVDAALARGRAHYEAEIARAGMASRASEFLALYEPACAAQRATLLTTG